MRLLIYTPTWIDSDTGEDAILPECEAAIKSQVLRAGDEFDWHVTTDNPYPVPDHRNVLHQYQYAREYFLRGNWDALLTIEHDNVLPDREAVQRISDTPGDVIYAPYMLRHGPQPQLSTWQYVNDRNLGMSLSMYPRQLRAARISVVYRVCGCGMGCTLFRRNVVEQISFAASTSKNPCPDLGFARAALQAGFISHGRFDVPVLHWSNGRWLHPYGETSVKMRYLALQTINVFVDGAPLHLEAGESYDLPVSTADDLVRAGYARPEQAVERAVVEMQEQAIAPAQKRGRPRRTADA